MSSSVAYPIIINLGTTNPPFNLIMECTPAKYVVSPHGPGHAVGCNLGILYIINKAIKRLSGLMRRSRLGLMDRQANCIPVRHIYFPQYISLKYSNFAFMYDWLPVPIFGQPYISAIHFRDPSGGSG
jgi:hypothetical protein